MAAYYSGPRVRLPSNRSLQLTDSASSSSPLSPSPPLASPPTTLSHSLAPILIFPAPSSAPASPYPSTSRARTHSALAHGPLRLRHARVDSNASSASLVVCSSVTDLSSPLSGNSPRLARSHLQSASASDWDDLGAVSGPSTGSGVASSPLTRERIVRLGSARMIPSSWRSVSGGSGETPSVEMWEWTSSGSEVDPDRGLWGEDGGTNYEDALSQFHFPTLEQSRFACPVERVGAPVAPLEEQRSLMSVSVRPTHPALGQRVIKLPFRALLETVLSINPATLMLLERGSHDPESIEQTGLFGTATGTMPVEDEDELGAIERSEDRRHGAQRVLLEAAVARSVRRGFDALVQMAEPAGVSMSLPLKVSICLLASIPRRVWDGIPTMPKWRS